MRSLSVALQSKVYREVFFRVRPLFYAQILLRFQSRRLVPRITMNLSHQLGGMKKREILKSKISTSPKLKEDGLCQQGKLQVVRRGWCESGVECCELWTLDGQPATCQNVEDVHQWRIQNHRFVQKAIPSDSWSTAVGKIS